MDLKEIGWEGIDWMHLAQDRDQWRALVNRVTNLRAFLICYSEACNKQRSVDYQLVDVSFMRQVIFPHPTNET